MFFIETLLTRTFDLRTFFAKRLVTYTKRHYTSLTLQLRN